MFKQLPLEEFYRLINHGPCVLITAGTIEKANVAPIAWTMPVNDDPPLVAIAVAESHYTAELINKTGEFVLNVPDLSLMRELIGTGRVSGRKEDKIKKFNITLQEASVSGRTPHIDGAIGYIECSVFDKHIYDGVFLFIGKVLYAAVRDDLYDGCLIPEKSPTAHHLGGGWFMVGEKRIKI